MGLADADVKQPPCRRSSASLVLASVAASQRLPASSLASNASQQVPAFQAVSAETPGRQIDPGARLRSVSAVHHGRGGARRPSIVSRPTSSRSVRVISTSRIRGPSPSAATWTATVPRDEADDAVPPTWMQPPAPVMYRTPQGDVQYAASTPPRISGNPDASSETAEGGIVTRTTRPRPQDQVLPAVARRLEAERLASSSSHKVARARHEQEYFVLQQEMMSHLAGETTRLSANETGTHPLERLSTPRPTAALVSASEWPPRRPQSPVQADATRGAIDTTSGLPSSFTLVATSGLFDGGHQTTPANLLGSSQSRNLVDSGRPAPLRTRESTGMASHLEPESRTTGCCTRCIVS